ncbi:MAG: ABC-2 family transporter protein [Bdellovibrionaceae bacterium]|nr:ABC-2 family transporter protein [Bdellovibrionales bacterium]MCB9082734.1 ABC-2 family transporter protein [Pseudobdellovibrionaceae bacterium]
MSHWTFLRALIATNLKASTALRGAFLMQCFFMVLNNLIFFAVWWIFFKNFREIGGWGLPEITALYGVVAGCFGWAMILGGGIRHLARMITDGDLDSFMTQPKNLLVHAAGSHSMASGWGDVISAIILIHFSGYLTWHNLPVLVLCMISGTLLFMCAGVLFNSMAFFLGPVDTLARQMFEFVVTFSVYPQTIFTGYMKLMLFTLIPAGFIGYLPIEALRDFRWSHLVAIIVGTAAYAGFTLVVFHLGLKRYTSGNRVGVRV